MDEDKLIDEENMADESEEMDENEKKEFDVVRYVNKSSYRRRAMKAIGHNVKIPKEIAHDSDILQNHISNVLRDLKDKELVECLNPDMKKGRLYRLSENGLDILDKVE